MLVDDPTNTDIISSPIKDFRNCPGWFAAWSAQLTVAGGGLLGA
jgi:hypothetical protein